jgi:hypothetical protein
MEYGMKKDWQDPDDGARHAVQRSIGICMEEACECFGKERHYVSELQDKYRQFNDIKNSSHPPAPSNADLLLESIFIGWHNIANLNLYLTMKDSADDAENTISGLRECKEKDAFLLKDLPLCGLALIQNKNFSRRI